MTRLNSLVRTFGALAFLALLGACGGSGSTPEPTPPPVPPPPGPTALETAVELDSRLDDVDVKAHLDAAIESAGKLSVTSVHGESKTAEANAQAVLDEHAAIMKAVTDADAVISEANAELMAAEDIADATEKAAVIGLLESAIREAEGIKMTAEGYLDPAPGTTTGIDNLIEAVAAVTGGAGADPMKTPADVGKAVAAAIQAALGSADPATNADVTAATDDAVLRNDYSDIGAMTWAQIVGPENVMKIRRLDGAAVTQVDSVSVSGSATMFTADAAIPANLTDTDDAADGTQVADGDYFAAEHMGIPGTVFCASNDCVMATDGDLSGSWYFTPAQGTELYVAATGANAGKYVQASLYGRYGYWLSEDGSAIALHSALGSIVTGATTTNTANLDLGADENGNDVTARYSGNAVGFSVRNDGDGDAVASGHFDADVSLTASFGGNPTLGGHISGFRGNAVNSNWRVQLNQVNLAGTTVAVADGVASGGGAAGVWTATGYGPAQTQDANGSAVNHRPEGFVGRFNANFSDGAAAGAYATRAD